MIEKEFQNKIFLVTGGSKGIGRCICLELAKKKAKVIFTYRKKDQSVLSLNKLIKKNNFKLFGYQIKNLKENSIKLLIKKIKKIHGNVNFLINNIGDAISRTKFIKSKDKLWVNSLDINLMSAVRTTRSVLTILNKNKLEAIVNIGSVAGKTFGQGDSLHYGVAKSALHGFSIGLSKELEKTRVNCVSPNAVNTSFQKRLSSKKRIKNIINKNKAGRLATPEEVAELTIFLCSKKTSYINGEVIYLTGGLK